MCSLLSPEDLIEEFSHTIIHQRDGPSPPNEAEGAAPATAQPKAGGAAASRQGREGSSARPKSGTGAGAGAASTAGRGLGKPQRVAVPPAVTKRPSGPSAGATVGGAGKKTAGGTRGKSPGPTEREEEDPTQRALRLKEAADVREAMREQIKRDRQANKSKAASSCGKTLSAFEIVLSSSGGGGAVAAAAGGAAGGAGAGGGSSANGPSSGPNADVVVSRVVPDAQVRGALQQAFPGTRLLTEDERRTAQEDLTRRQQEVVAQVQGSQEKGEKGRAMLNEAQRELLEINRLRNAVSRRYVLVRTDPEAASTSDFPQAGSTIAGIPVEHVAVIDELEDDADEVDDEEDDYDEDLEEEAAQDETRAGETMRVGQTIRPHGATRADPAKPLLATRADPIDPLGATMRVPLPAGKLPTDLRSTGRSAVAWEIGGTPQKPEEGSRGGATGGIAFDVTLDAPASKAMRASQKAASGKRAPEAPAPETPGARTPESASNTLTVPAQLFGAGTPLSDKVLRLRTHLVEQLGGQSAFDRVYKYVSREESGEQQSGEREAILAFMAEQGQRELLPLVHTLLYLEDALGTRKV